MWLSDRIPICMWFDWQSNESSKQTNDILAYSQIWSSSSCSAIELFIAFHTFYGKSIVFQNPDWPVSVDIHHRFQIFFNESFLWIAKHANLNEDNCLKMIEKDQSGKKSKFHLSINNKCIILIGNIFITAARVRWNIALHPLATIYLLFFIFRKQNARPYLCLSFGVFVLFSVCMCVCALCFRCYDIWTPNRRTTVDQFSVVNIPSPLPDFTTAWATARVCFGVSIELSNVIQFEWFRSRRRCKPQWKANRTELNRAKTNSFYARAFIDFLFFFLKKLRTSNLVLST